MRSLGGHRGAVRAVAYLPDGRLVSAGQDGRVLLHPPHGDAPELLHKSKRPVYAVAVRPDGGRLAFAGRLVKNDPTNPVHLLNLANPGMSRVLQCLIEGRELVPVGLNWRPELFTGPVARSVWSLGWSADGRFLAAAVRQPGGANIPDGGGGRWWNCDTGETKPLPADTFVVAYSPVGHELAICRYHGVQGYAKPWDAEPVWRLPTTCAWPTAAFALGGQLAVAAGGGFLYPRGRRRVKTGFRAVTAVAVSPDGRALLVGGAPGGVEVYDAESGTRRAALDFDLGVVHAVAVAPDGLTAAAGGDRGLAAFDL